ncbi:MAG TPA: hypothetical protein VHF65_10175 [Nitrososphaera sp.]|nr:hypothetical protein [Nitrososphaera sp.]
MDFTQRWLLMLAIATGVFAISLLLLRINIRTLLILLGIGLPLVTLWLYMDARYFSAQRSSNSPRQMCACPICKHQQTSMCFEKNCSCCLITKGEKVIGHSSSTLQ